MTTFQRTSPQENRQRHPFHLSALYLKITWLKLSFTYQIMSKWLFKNRAKTNPKTILPLSNMITSDKSDKTTRI